MKVCSLACNISSAPNIYVTLPHKNPASSLAISRAPRSHLESINYFLEEAIAGSTSVDFVHLNDTVEFEDFDSLADNVVVRDCEKLPKTSTLANSVPVVRSSIGGKKLDSLRGNLHTYEARNFVADRGVDLSCSDMVADRMVQDFIDTYIDENVLREETIDDIDFTLSSLGEWSDKRDGRRFANLLKDVETPIDLNNDLTSFKLMVKTDAKPKLDDSVLSKLPAGQNIVFHRPAVNALFSHVFTQVTARLQRCLKRNFLLFVGDSIESFEQQISESLVGRINEYYCAEVDISKYDKSQGPITKQIEEKLLRRLGCSDEFLNLWYSSEYDSSCTTMDKSLTMSVGAQRRTGASNTWLGNTLVNMVLLAYCRRFNSDDCVFFAGDDSLLLSRNPHFDCFSKLNLEFGFDVKFYPCAAPYFCSKYFVDTEDGVKIVPDPLKLLTKLGRVFAKDKFLGREQFISFRDVTKNYSRDDVMMALTLYHEKKYGPNRFTFDACCAVHCLAANFDQFSRLAYKKTGVAFGFEFLNK